MPSFAEGLQAGGKGGMLRPDAPEFVPSQNSGTSSVVKDLETQNRGGSRRRFNPPESFRKRIAAAKAAQAARNAHMCVPAHTGYTIFLKDFMIQNPGME